MTTFPQTIDPTAGPAIYRAMRDFQRSLLARETEALVILTQRWKRAEDALMGQILATAQEMIDAQERGETITAFALMRRNERYRTLLTQVRGEIERYESYAERTIIQMQTEAGQLGLDSASTALRVAMRGNFQMLPSQPFEFMTGVCADGKPLFSLLQERALFPDAVDGMTQALLDGLAFGESPRKVARRMAGGLSAGLNKALTIARTEQIRAYREATRARYAQAGIKKYRRHVALQDRTCLACLSLDGTVQDTEEIVASHPNCRCYTTPEIDGLDLRGGDGQAWFERQDEATQKKIMGATRWKMWKEGQVGWGDFAKIKDDPVWGPTIGLKPVRDLKPKE